ncbi:hypothetical protein DNTS_004560 [Danionella cerebrum]|uniref:UDENN FNIP1/2-type domain-containing protein n=1 Tax=Danionella cerebrum TaxID=2873325 RepID=A0A553PJ29_9TELE|nr:hypothetical protein DNTS_004560 [Danionella translucida]
MAPTLFHKLFNKRNALSPPSKCSKEDTVFSWSSPELEPSQIRLIVYQDCERRGRNVLFDSNTRKKSAEESMLTASSRGSSDANMLGEMMFGSVAMSYKGSTLKIHQIRSPPQLMLSKVFTARTGGSAYGSLNTSLQDSLEFIGQDPAALRPEQNTNANGFLNSIGHSNPMDMPGRGVYDERDSGIARSASLSSLLITPFPSPGSSLSSAASSFQRRWLRSQTTSLENGLFPRWSVEESFNLSDESSGSSLAVARKKKIAIGVIFTLSAHEEESSRFQDFFFSHFPLFESHMNKLKSAIEQAMILSRRSADASQRAMAYILTNHLAWVPTVMPNGQPPIKTFLEKHSSQSVDLLAKTHPYNPLWAQLGDLYGAIGSPVRLSRTVVIGRRQEVVQRLLYVLTYFIRCSELLETHLLDHAEDEAIVMPPGSLLTTSLHPGEVEGSEYVVVTLHPPRLQGFHPEEEQEENPDEQQMSAEASVEEHDTDKSLCRDSGSPALETRIEKVLKVGSTSPGEGRSFLESPGDTTIRIVHSSDVLLEKKPPDKSFTHGDAGQEISGRVTFLIGDSMSPESDLESRQQRLEEQIRKHRKIMLGNEERTKPDQNLSNIPVQPSLSRKASQWCPSVQRDCVDMFDEYFSEDNPVETRTIDDVCVVKDDLSQQPQGDRFNPLKIEGPRFGKPGKVCCKSCASMDQDKGIEICLSAPSPDRKPVQPLNDWEIPRNESSDSALGDSESEDAAQETHCCEDEQSDWQDELEVPLPGGNLVENFSKPSIANFGRSLFGGYCPTYVPDFVLHGIPTDEKLKQSLLADLAHAVQHPVLDEPIAEAVCIMADTEKWTVHVCSSQRRGSERLGQEVLVSSLVSGLLQSTMNLYRLNLAPNFCVMHLEDRLQELYFKSKMLAEYLKGQTRVHDRIQRPAAVSSCGQHSLSSCGSDSALDNQPGAPLERARESPEKWRC